MRGRGDSPETEGARVRDPAFEARVRESFGRQRLMEFIGARLRQVAPGKVEIEAPIRKDLSQQHGYLHAGVITALIDSACGYSALTLSPPGTEVLTVEFKVNFLAPASGTVVVGRAWVVRAGRSITVCAGEAVVTNDSRETTVATMLATMLIVDGER
jgi:uncharacterized protein (TIGR00369 family)